MQDRGTVLVVDRSPLVADVLARGLLVHGVPAEALPWPGRPGRCAAAVLLDGDGPVEEVLGAAAVVDGAGPILLVLGSSGGPAARRLTARTGARGWVSRQQPLDALVSATRLTAAGRPVPLPVPHLLPSLSDGLETLTAREREVLALLATGARNDAVARHLRISPHTARTHVSKVLAKLGVDNRVAAATVAHRAGLTVGAAS